MSTKRFACFLTLVATVVLAACGPAATSVPTEESLYPEPVGSAPPDDFVPAPAATEAPTQQPPATQSAEGDMFFQNYGVNPSVDTRDDNLSTFALNVDTGSYTVARRYINDGNLPPKDAIRVEEFVNYFDQGYPNPPEHHAFAINIDGASTPFGQMEHDQMMRVGIQGYAVPAEIRKSVSLTFVIDVSGSMDRENRLGLVKQSLQLLVDQLDSRDRVSIVAFGSRAHVVLEPIAAD